MLLYYTWQLKFTLHQGFQSKCFHIGVCSVRPMDSFYSRGVLSEDDISSPRVSSTKVITTSRTFSQNALFPKVSSPRLSSPRSPSSPPDISSPRSWWASSPRSPLVSTPTSLSTDVKENVVVSAGVVKGSSVGDGNSSSKRQCLCAPTTHVGSFRCRLHRVTSTTKSWDKPSPTSPDSSNPTTGTIEAL